MRSGVPEKLLKVVDDIAATGAATLTRLTVLKKWFERPDRLAAFALWMARRAISLKGKSTGEAAKLFRDAKALLKDLNEFAPVLAPAQREAAWALFQRLREFQNEYRKVHWTTVRQIKNWNLLLVEESIALLRSPSPHPAQGYKLAADYCQHYDPKYGNGLNGPSLGKIQEIARWMFRVEAMEEGAA